MTKITEKYLQVEDKKIRLVEIEGIASGPRLVITAGVHGCEYVGIQAVNEFLDEVKEIEFKGSLLVMPLVNVSGFHHGLRDITKEDGENINRAFPGDENGTFTFKLAKKIEDEVYTGADFLIDLHGGDINEDLTPLVFYPVAADEKTNAKAKKIASKLTTNYMVPSIAKDGLYSWANQKSIPALLLERGSMGLWSKEEVDLVKQNILEVMGGLGMIEERFSKGPIQIKKADYIKAKDYGHWYPDLKKNEVFKENAILGILKDHNGKILQEIRSVYAGVVLYQTMSLGVKKGDPLIAYGKI